MALTRNEYYSMYDGKYDRDMRHHPSERLEYENVHLRRENDYLRRQVHDMNISRGPMMSAIDWANGCEPECDCKKKWDVNDAERTLLLT